MSETITTDLAHDPASDPLAGDMNGNPDAPAWFHRALAHVPQYETIDVNGVAINIARWDTGSDRTVLLVHGDGAHLHWWDHIAPQLATGRNVVALDMSGHGDSARASAYSLHTWAEEVIAVARHCGELDTVTIVAHSMGGLVSMHVAYQYGDQLAGVVIIDSPVREYSPEFKARFTRLSTQALRVYPSRAAALSRFRLLPTQTDALPFLMRHLAHTSLRQVPGGWTWKHDPWIFSRDLEAAVTTGSPPPGRMALFRCEHGLVTDDLVEPLSRALGHKAPIVPLPGTGHHLMLDQPLLLVATLRTVLDRWEFEDGHRPVPLRTLLTGDRHVLHAGNGRLVHAGD